MTDDMSDKCDRCDRTGYESTCSHKPVDALEELRRVAVEYRRVSCEEEHHVSPGITVQGTIEIGCACWICDKMDAAIAAWEKERAEASLNRAIIGGWTAARDQYGEPSRLAGQLATLRAAVEKVRDDMRRPTTLHACPSCGVAHSARGDRIPHWAEVLDAALRGNRLKVRGGA